MNSDIQHTKFKLVPPKISFEEKFENPNLIEIESQLNFKNIKLNEASDISCNFVKKILKKVNLRKFHKNILVTIRSGYLNKGQYPCLSGWHLDTILNPIHNSIPEYHHLLVFGANCRTEFLKSPIEILLKDDLKRAYNEAMSEGNHEIISIPELQWVVYRRNNLHRPVAAKQDGFRFLIKVTETDIIKPQKYKESK